MDTGKLMQMFDNVPKVFDAKRHAGDPEAQAFHGQALLEGGVVAATDWNAA